MNQPSEDNVIKSSHCNEDTGSWFISYLRQNPISQRERIKEVPKGDQLPLMSLVEQRSKRAIVCSLDLAFASSCIVVIGDDMVLYHHHIGKQTEMT